MSSILAIDPGPTESAIVRYEDGEVTDYVQDRNDGILRVLTDDARADVLVIEQVRSYGMAVGAEVFDTVHWCGRFHQAWEARGGTVELLPRLKVKTHLCQSAKAKDTNIRQALLDKFGGKAATKKGGVLYGISGDLWAALAVAVTYAETHGTPREVGAEGGERGE